MSTSAASLVEQAKKWADNYGAFPNGEEGAALSAPLRLRAAWDSNDADALAEVFIDNGSLLLGEQLQGRDQIRSYLADAFQGGWKGSRLVEQPIEIRFLTPDVALTVAQGGVLQAGEDALPEEREERTMRVLVRRDGDWKIAAQQSSPIKG